MVNCSFCKGALGSGKGKMFVKNDGKIFYYCSSKCEKNFEIGRNPRKTNWVIKK